MSSDLKDLREHEERLEIEIKEKQKDLKCLRRSIEIVTGVVTQESSKYAGMKPQAAIGLFMKENPNKWFRSTVVMEKLWDLGFGRGCSSKTTWRASCYISLNRLAHSGLIQKEKIPVGTANSQVFHYCYVVEEEKV